MAIASNGSNIQSANGFQPCEGPRCLSYNLDFSAATEYDFDLTQQQQQGQFTTLQTVYIDNSSNAAALTLTVQGTNQVITWAPNTQGFVTIVSQVPAKFSISTSGGILIAVQLMNFYIPPAMWKTV